MKHLDIKNEKKSLILEIHQNRKNLTGYQNQDNIQSRVKTTSFPIRQNAAQ